MYYLIITIDFQVVGGCWYLLAIQRFASCLKQQCQKNNSCNLMSLTCSTAGLSPIFSSSPAYNLTASTAGWNIQACLDGDGSFPYGIYDSAPPVVSSNSLAVKILYPIFWGLMTLRYKQFETILTNKKGTNLK